MRGGDADDAAAARPRRLPQQQLPEPHHTGVKGGDSMEKLFTSCFMKGSTMNMIIDWLSLKLARTGTSLNVLFCSESSEVNFKNDFLLNLIPAVLS